MNPYYIAATLRLAADGFDQLGAVVEANKQLTEKIKKLEEELKQKVKK